MKKAFVYIFKSIKWILVGVAGLLLLVLLLGISWQLYRLQGQVESAQAEKDLLAAQVEVKRQEKQRSGRRRHAQVSYLGWLRRRSAHYQW